jgi:hypothetical protein
MPRTTTIRVTAEQLEAFAFEKGVVIHLGPASATIRVGSKVFEAPLPIIPTQRSGS